MPSPGIMHELSGEVLHMQLVLENRLDAQEAVQEVVAAEQNLSGAESAARSDGRTLARLKDKVGEISSRAG